MPPKPKYTLHYFNGRGRAEIIRLIFAQGGVEFTDDRIKGDDWPTIKPKTPDGTLPYLEVEGRVIGQSNAIARFVAKECNLAGKDKYETAAIDQFMENIVDFTKPLIDAFLEKDAEKKAEKQKNIKEVVVPNFVKKVEAKLAASKSGWLVGGSISCADIGLYSALENTVNGPDGAEVLKMAPKLKAHREKVASQPRIKAYLAKRPKTDF